MWNIYEFNPEEFSAEFGYNPNVVARATRLSRNNLDSWNGHNMQNGGTGLHRGITLITKGKIAGKFVIVSASDWQGSDDDAFVVSAKEAAKEIIEAEWTENDIEANLGTKALEILKPFLPEIVE